MKKIYPNFEWEQITTEPLIYLTFDDGPHPEITNWVIDILKKFEAKATFFCVGENAVQHPQIMILLRVSGHSIGNHTFNHLKGWQSSDLKYLKNSIAAIPVTSGSMFRPPYGRITRRQGILLKSKGFRIVMWSLLSCDYLKTLNKQKSLDALVKNSKPGSIVVFHDSIKAKANLQWILPRYLEAMQAKGYKFAAL